MPIPCRSIATCASSRRGRRRRRGARAAPALRPCRCRREFLRRAPGWPMPPRCWPKRARRDRLPIFTGGSGLYFKALTRGLSAVPPIPAEIREDVRARLERDGVEALHAELARRDPASRRAPEAARPHPHRARAGGGRGDRAFADRLASRRPAAAVAAGRSSARCFSTPERDALYARIDARFDAMLASGRAGRGRSARRRGSSIRCCRR